MDLNDFYALFHDVGCASPRTFARRLILGVAKISECPQIKGVVKEKIVRALKDGVTYACASCAYGSASVILRPCKAEGKTTGEIRISCKNKRFPLFDAGALFEIALKEGALKNISYSEELGFISLRMGEKNIFVFENGLIRVKQAEDRKDVEETIEYVRALIKKAEICGVCGGTMDECRAMYCMRSDSDLL
ncbi:MAG: hypothetical protein KAJ91_02290 [Candidatus Aenigmarchaeota archaeon]|nr:hypothetical protein [Candidatus Aenigmarchaeota archaeon]